MPRRAPDHVPLPRLSEGQGQGGWPAGVRRPSCGDRDMSRFQQFSRKQEQTQQVHMRSRRGEAEAAFPGLAGIRPGGSAGGKWQGFCQVRLGLPMPQPCLWPPQATTEDMCSRCGCEPGRGLKSSSGQRALLDTSDKTIRAPGTGPHPLALWAHPDSSATAANMQIPGGMPASYCVTQRGKQP